MSIEWLLGAAAVACFLVAVQGDKRLNHAAGFVGLALALAVGTL